MKEKNLFDTHKKMTYAIRLSILRLHFAISKLTG